MPFLFIFLVIFGGIFILQDTPPFAAVATILHCSELHAPVNVAHGVEIRVRLPKEYALNQYVPIHGKQSVWLCGNDIYIN